jgi:hypothetical protein
MTQRAGSTNKESECRIRFINTVCQMKILSRNPNAKTRIEDSLKLRIRMGIYIQRMLLQGLDSQIVPHHKICHEYMSVE